MRKDILCLFAVISVGVILVAGCTTTSSGTTAAPSAPGQETVATLVNGTDAFNASIYQVTASRPQPGDHQIDIYLTTLNTGNATVKLHWFSRITGPNGVSYGGVGVSHGGSGQETDILGPGSEGTGRGLCHHRFRCGLCSNGKRRSNAQRLFCNRTSRK